MCEEARTCDSRVRVRVNSRDANIWTGIHQFCLCGIPYKSGRSQVQGESHMLIDGGSGRDSRDGLAIQQPHCYQLQTAQSSVPKYRRTGDDII